MRRKLGFAGEVSTDVTWSSAGGVRPGAASLGLTAVVICPESSLSTSDLVPLKEALPVHEHWQVAHAKVELKSELDFRGHVA